MPIQGSDLLQLTVNTINKMERLKFTDLSSDYRDTVGMKKFFRKNKMTFDSGPEVEFRVLFDTNQSARSVGLAYVAQSSMPNTTTFGKVPWRHVTANWSTERRVLKMNRGSERILNILQTERLSALGDLIKLFEYQVWRVPAAADNISLFGIPYYVVKSNTLATKANNDGFNGDVPAGYSSVANLTAAATNNRWRNYATQYTAVTFDDLVRKARRAMYKTKFKPLVDDYPVFAKGFEREIYTNYAVYSVFEELLRSQNENLGMDLAATDEQVVFRKVNVVCVDELDNDTTNPVYGIDWKELMAMGLEGEWMYENPIPVNPNQPTVATVHLDCTCNLYCRNRRKQWVLATDTSMAY